MQQLRVPSKIRTSHGRVKVTTQQELIVEWRRKAELVQKHLPVMGVVNEQTIAVVLCSCAEELEKVIEGKEVEV